MDAVAHASACSATSVAPHGRPSVVSPVGDRRHTASRVAHLFDTDRRAGSLNGSWRSPGSKAEGDRWALGGLCPPAGHTLTLEGRRTAKLYIKIVIRSQLVKRVPGTVRELGRTEKERWKLENNGGDELPRNCHSKRKAGGRTSARRMDRDRAGAALLRQFQNGGVFRNRPARRTGPGQSCLRVRPGRRARSRGTVGSGRTPAALARRRER